MNRIITKSSLILILFSLGLLGCKSNAMDPIYNPNEFTLLIAASNDGEVGPCG